MKWIYCGLAFALVGCAPQMRTHIAGFDGSPVDPVSQERFTTECSAKAQVAKSGVPYTGSGLGRAIEMNSVEQAAFQGCMAEKGLKVTYVPIQTASVSPVVPSE